MMRRNKAIVSGIKIRLILKVVISIIFFAIVNGTYTVNAQSSTPDSLTYWQTDTTK